MLVNGPKSIVCTNAGDRCWYANEGTSEICEVDMNSETVIRVEGEDIATGEILTDSFQQSRGVELFYPPPHWFCIKDVLCPSSGSPVLLAADTGGHRIVAIDTDTWNAVVLHEWPGEDFIDGSDENCPMRVREMAISYDPYPVLFAISGSRIERISLETGESWTIDENDCQREGDEGWNQGLVVSGDDLFVAQGRTGIRRYRIIERKQIDDSDLIAQKYVDYPESILITGNATATTTATAKPKWGSVVAYPPKPSSSDTPIFLLLNEQDYSLHTYSNHTTAAVPLERSRDDNPLEGVLSMNWYDDYSDSLAVANTLKNRVQLFHLNNLNYARGGTSMITFRAGRSVRLPEKYCPRISRKKPRVSTLGDELVADDGHNLVRPLYAFIVLALLLIVLIAGGYWYLLPRSSRCGKGMEDASDGEDTGDDTDDSDHDTERPEDSRNNNLSFDASTLPKEIESALDETLDFKKLSIV